MDTGLLARVPALPLAAGIVAGIPAATLCPQWWAAPAVATAGALILILLRLHTGTALIGLALGMAAATLARDTPVPPEWHGDDGGEAVFSAVCTRGGVGYAEVRIDTVTRGRYAPEAVRLRAVVWHPGGEAELAEGYRYLLRGSIKPLRTIADVPYQLIPRAGAISRGATAEICLSAAPVQAATPAAAAARIKDKNPDTKIVALSMGPEQAKAALKECLAIAADKAYLVSDRAFGGSDTLATSYILSHTIQKVEELEGNFDAIFCGKQAIDGDTAQVGPEIAEHLDLPQVTYGLEAEADGGALRVRKEVEEGVEVIAVRTPCVVTFTKPAWEPRYPTLKRKLAAGRAEIPTLTAADLPAIDLANAGLKGSPTKVKRTFVPQKKTGGVKIQEADGGAAAKKLYELLGAAGIV